ncbi:hypothetical protein QN412_09845 [Pseudomonas sp. RTB3]|uniref:TIR domain-containing protein n=1 Tax=unclassified Pseudomonas TaxID=196821 RepID=UPI002B22FC1E|nr:MULTISPECIES: hypothetical protein [unclassified Pseudomonas]MEB0009847.1 hypothetical protein [Pseudomonas sp. RTB2]MEB0017257.1 hypothetical protein [Pseudomonas sp. RTB3]MEB0270634.1 hypothetical protein [Pseudomonas sp. 5B4]
MSNRNGNYCAFYVAEPFNESSLQAHATPDFVYYNMLRAWKGKDSSFPFSDSHAKTYSVRDGSDWEMTLKPRLRQRLQASKNIILFLSSTTLESKALREEVDYGISNQGLPVIVAYPGFDSLLADGSLKKEVKNLWAKLPTFKSLMGSVPTLHVPLQKELIKKALTSSNFVVATKCEPNIYRYDE